MRILKYEIELSDRPTDIALPRGSYFCHAGEQHERLFTWWVVVDYPISDSHRIRIMGTGEPFPEGFGYRFLATVQMNDGLVWHLLTVSASQAERQ